METVRASDELAQGHIASGLKPLLWKALRNESQEVRDPEKKNTSIVKCFTLAMRS